VSRVWCAGGTEFADPDSWRRLCRVATARGLEHALRADEAEITVVGRDNFSLFTRCCRKSAPAARDAPRRHAGPRAIAPLALCARDVIAVGRRAQRGLLRAGGQPRRAPAGHWPRRASARLGRDGRSRARRTSVASRPARSGEHRLKDLARPECVYQLVAPDLTTEFPPLRSLDAQRTTCPARSNRSSGARPKSPKSPPHRRQSTGHAGRIGRRRQDANVAPSRRTHARPISDGAWLIELAPLSSGEYVPSTVARALVSGSSPRAIRFIISWPQ